MSHRHFWPHDLDCKPLADDVCISKAEGAYIVGFEIGEDRRAVGSVPIGADGWTESGSFEDGTLTLSPSLDWTQPPHHRHGFVTSGRWVSV